MHVNLRSTKIRWSKETINKARELRTSGLSYSDLSKHLGISKSTLHGWIHEIKRPGFITKEDQNRHLKNIRPIAIKANRRKKQERLDAITKSVKAEVDSYKLLNNQEYMRSLLSMLYWAEGSKTGGSLRFTNTDPKLTLLFITLLRKCYPIDESKFRVRLHLHYYHPIIRTRKFWSSLLEVPEDKFGKIYIKPRSKTKKFRKNFAGICFVVYHSKALMYEVLEKAKYIGEKLVPVA